MEELKIIITHSGETVDIAVSNPDIDARLLTEMHCAFVTAFLEKLTKLGKTPEDAVEAVSLSDEAAIKAFVEESLYA